MAIHVIDEEIPRALAGERLDRVVALLADVSRSAAVALIAGGAVRIDGDVVSSGKQRLDVGARIEIDETQIPGATLPTADSSIDLDVVHADDDVVVVDKAAGLVVHPGAGNPDGTLVNGLLARYPEIAAVGEPSRPGIVHRLDAGSSGLLVVARSAMAYGSLVRQFADHTAGRRYTALVWGHPEAPHGVIDAPIGRDAGDPTRMAVVVGGRPARTEYEVVEQLVGRRDVALLACRLETGRTHQIRVHLAAIGHPLVGDTTYGAGRSGLVGGGGGATPGLGRPFLHAGELSFDHPDTAARLTFTSDLPADLAAVLEGLELR